MKRLVLLLFLALAALVLWSVKAEQILKSPDVIAYESDGQAYLMDVNSGDEIKIKTANSTCAMLWNQDGSVLYRAYINQDISKSPMENRIILYSISLPDLKETQLIETFVADNDVVGVKLALGKDGSIYIIKTDLWEDENKVRKSLDYACGYYSFVWAKYIPLEEQNGLTPDLYIDPLHQPQHMKGFDIITKVCEGYALNNHYELFAHRQEETLEEGKLNWIQLSRYLNLEGSSYMHLHKAKKPDYKLSPNHKTLLVSYPYYISDENTTFYHSFLYSLDPEDCTYKTVNKELWDESKNELVMTKYNELQTQIKLQAGSIFSLKDDYWYEWTKDGRMVYSKEQSMSSDKMVVGVSGLLLLDKTLKAYKGDLPAHLYYRYLP